MKIVKRSDEPLYRPFGAAGDQTQKTKQGGGEATDEKAGDGGGQKKIAKKGEDLKAEMDSLIDEIDEVLEENAEEFVKNYVQHGGE